MATTNQSGGVCGDSSDHQHNHAYEDHDVDILNDPTLMSCCDKDRIAYDRAMDLKRVLTAHDPSTQNVRMRQQVVAMPPTQESLQSVTTSKKQAQVASAAAAIAHQLCALEVQSDNDDDSDLELDEDIDALYALRHRELAAQFEMAAKNARDGYGIILDTDFPSLLKELSSSPAVPRVAFVRSARLDASIAHGMLTQMLSLANRFLGTKFYAITTTTNDEEAMRQLRVTTAPTVVAFRRGQRIDATAIQEKDLVAMTASILWEARLVPWLTMCNVLEATRQDAPTTAPHVVGPQTTSVSGGNGDGDGNSEDAAFDCGVGGCRIRFAYEHEHVGPSSETKAEVSAWRTSASTPA